MIKKFIVLIIILIVLPTTTADGLSYNNYDKFVTVNNGVINSYSVIENENLELRSDFEYHRSLITNDKSYQELYEQLINFIKFHEGFCQTSYACPAGYLTIGYGHVIQTGESFPDTITKAYADSLLRKDLNSSIKMAERLSPQLKGTKLLAIAHFCFAKGPGNYERSTLRKLINSNQDPTEEFRKWCKYKSAKTGEIVTSQYSLNIREYEIKLYNFTK